MHGIRVTEQVVHITENLLISPRQKDTHIVRFLAFQSMHRQVMGNILGRDEVGNLSIRITGNILQRSRTVGFLIQALDRQNRENLVYRPRVRQGLEK